MLAITYKIKQQIFLVVVIMGVVLCLGAVTPATVFAAQASAGNGGGDTASSKSCASSDGLCADCQNGGDGCVDCTNGVCSDPAADPSVACSKHNCDLVKKYVNPTISLLSVTFGVIAAASLIGGGIQYSASEGDPQKVSAAKSRITKTILAIIAYLFLYGFLQFLIPGGIFNRS